jgi:hypothetical protein
MVWSSSPQRKAILRPSGDHTGLPNDPRSVRRSRRNPVPSAFTTKRPLYSPRERTKVSRSPRGDQSGADPSSTSVRTLVPIPHPGSSSHWTARRFPVRRVGGLDGIQPIVIDVSPYPVLPARARIHCADVEAGEVDAIARIDLVDDPVRDLTVSPGERGVGGRRRRGAPQKRGTGQGEGSASHREQSSDPTPLTTPLLEKRSPLRA